MIVASKQMAEILTRIIKKEKSFRFEGLSNDFVSAIEVIKKKSVDVIIIDSSTTYNNFHLIIKKFSEECPIPIIFLFSLGQKINLIKKEIPYEIVIKAQSEIGILGFTQELMVKIKIISMEKVDKKKLTLGNKNQIIAIGASTGGVEALGQILCQLPEEIPGIVVVQHIPQKFSKLFADRLNSQCRITVKEALDGEEIKPGLALIAAGDKHLKVVKNRDKYIVKTYTGNKINGHCPSVDVLFESVADTVGADAIGVILTGMGYDGAKGLLRMKEKGSFTIGQDRKSSAVYGMPMEAYNLGAVDKQVSLENIARELVALTR